MNGKCYSLQVRSLGEVNSKHSYNKFTKKYECGNLSNIIKHIYFQCRLIMQKIFKKNKINRKERDKRTHHLLL